MNTDVNQFLVFRQRFNLYIGMFVKCCKKNDRLPCCAGLARSPLVLTEHISSWRVSEASETLSGVYKFELVQYIYTYGGTCVIIVAHAMHT